MMMMVQASLLLGRASALAGRKRWASSRITRLVSFTSTRLHSSNTKTSSSTSTTSTSALIDVTDTTSAQQLPLIIPTDGGVPIHLYTTEIEPDALAQLQILARSPLPVDYISAMPDVHLGKGVTIGTVFASSEYICPNAVGVDIGCGMAAVPIDNLYHWQLSLDDKIRIQKRLKQRIPTGFKARRKWVTGAVQVLEELTDELEPSEFLRNELVRLPKAQSQLGTLGGGNHFLEVVYEETEGQVWVMLHSGSRYMGNRVASHYDQVAKNLLERKGVDTRKLNGLNYMPIDSQEGQDYMTDMLWCQQYAFHNRRVMKEIMLEIMDEVTKCQADMNESVNIHHNYCSCEECGDGRQLWVTRKGATSAKLGEKGIIPGSMGTGSYITKGKGNLTSWNSSSHGAGRRMSRKKAHANIAQEDFVESMKGIVCDTKPGVKDEAPQAYKDLSQVMANQSSLTEVVCRLLPIINVKGFDKRITTYRPREEKQNEKEKKKKKKKR